MTTSLPAIALSLIVAAQPAPQPAERPRSKAWLNPEGDMLDRLLIVARASPTSCGRFTLEGPPLTQAQLKSAIACVSKSASDRQAATVTIRLPGTDSWRAYGLLATAGGVLHWFNYDSDITGGHDYPQLTEGVCRRPKQRTRRGIGPTFSCSK